MQIQQDVDRRTFYTKVIYGVWAVIAGALALPAVGYLFVPPKTKRTEDWTDAADLTQLTPNVPEEVVFRRNRVDGWKVTSEKKSAWVLKRPDNSVVAFSPICTHLGCAVRWDDSAKNFQCPCHTSVFSTDGKVVSGPAPRALDRYAVKVENNRLLIGGIERAKA